MSETRHLLIDGYNVIHDWPHLRSLLPTRPEAARDRLAEEVRILHDREGWRVTLVFDGKGEEITIERPGGPPTFSLVFSPSGMSADDIIERLVAADPKSSRITVVTRDTAQRQTIEAFGAIGMSPSELRDWIRRAGAGLASALGTLRRQVDKEWRRPLGETAP